MQKLIHNAVRAALMNRPERKPNNSLWVSDLGRNPYSTVRRLLTGEPEPFDYATALKMDGGAALESFTLQQIAQNLDRPIQTQFPLFSSVWTGYADLVIGHGSEDVIIYDHKGSCGRWWDYKESLPRSADCCQVWMYGQLYFERFGVWPRLGLYYRGWGTWADFEVREIEAAGGGIYLEAAGHITDEKGEAEYVVTRSRAVNPYWLRLELEDLHRLAMNGIPLDDLVTDPGGPDWDYAENATRRLSQTHQELPEASDGID